MRLRGVYRSLLAIVFALVSLPASAAPAMWVVHGAKATVYLFGTIHVLKVGTSWHTPAFDKAFAESKELWLELPADSDKAKLKEVVQRLGFDAEHPLSSRFSFNEIARIDAVARGAGMTRGAWALDTMRPWLASFILGGAPLKRSGYRGGVETELEANAQATGKPIGGLETFEAQLHLMADLPDAAQEAMLVSTLDNLSKSTAALDGLVATWLKGDEAGLDRLLNETRAKAPDFYRVLVVQRNIRFAERIDAMAKGSGIAMVAIGAAHFVGPDGVIAMLAKKGIAADRLSDPSPTN